MSLERDTLAVGHEAAFQLRCAQEHLLVPMLLRSSQRAALHKILTFKASFLMLTVFSTEGEGNTTSRG